MESSLVSYLYELHVLIEEEGVYLPTVIVLGDDCSLKSHLLESMGELRLGEGDRISSNMPLLIRYQHHEGGQHIQLEKKGHPITDAVIHVSSCIERASLDGIEDETLTLVVKNRGIRDLLVMDMPAIGTYDEEIKLQDMVIRKGQLAETLIVNILSATNTELVNCKVLEWSTLVDKDGKRTLNVLCLSQEELGIDLSHLLPVISGKKGLECVIVIVNGNENSEDEFQTAYPQQLAKHLVGVHSLAEKITELQNAMIINFLPNLSHQIDQRLNSEIRDLPKEMKLGGVVHAFSKFILDLKEVLKTEYVNLIRARLKDLSEQIKEKLKSSKNTFLEDEIAALDSGDSDSDHPPHLILVNTKMGIACTELHLFVKEACEYLQIFSLQPLSGFTDDNMDLLPDIMIKVVKPFVNQVKEDLTQRVQETIEAEALTWYTSDQASFDSSKRLQQENLESFMTATRSNMSEFNLECHGMIQIDHLQDVAEDKRKKAFKLWMKFNRYIPVVTLRLVDGIAIHLRYLITKGVLKQMTDNFIKEMFIERDTLANWVPNTTSNIISLHASRRMVDRMIGSLPITAHRGMLRRTE